MIYQLSGLTLATIITLFACTSNGQNEMSKDDTATTTTEQTTAHPAAPIVTSNGQLPSLQMKTVNGETISLEQFKGKKVFVNLWASWCPPCKKEMPSIQKLYQSTDTSKVAFVLLSLDDQFEKATNYAASQKLKLPLYYPTQQLPALFNVEGIPATFIFSESGELMKRIDGMENYDTKAFRDLLK